MTIPAPLISVSELAESMSSTRSPTLLDVRWSLGGGGRSAYDAGHLPGSAFVDLDSELSGTPGTGGRHPLPEPSALAASLRAAGVRDGHPVVVYDAGGANPTGAAARAWWTLRWAGLPPVRVLDGGYAAWLAAGQPVTTGPVEPEVGELTVSPGGMAVADAGRAAELARSGLLLDARVAARYRGETEPVDRVAGRIPGAVNLPAAELVDPAGRLRTPGELRKAFAALGARGGEPVGAYCGSGVTAAQTVLAATVAGLEPVLYVGSWSNWISDPERPVATGDPAADRPAGAGSS